MRKISLQQDSKEWLNWRKNGIGSSDIAKIMGVSPFGTAMDVYNEKAGLSTEKKASFAMNKGKINEPISREKFNRSQKAHYEPACFEHEKYRHFIASVDGYDEITNTIIEIKTPGKKDLTLAKEGIIPEYYSMQMQWQMGITHSDYGYYIAYSAEEGRNYIQEVSKNEQIISKMEESASRFWQNFLQGIPPEKQSKDHDIFFENELNNIEVIEENYILAKANYDQAVKFIEKCKQELINCNQGHSFKTPRISVTKTEPRTTYDIEALMRDGHDLERYKKRGESGWRISINK